jgi:hypothetical protein
MAHKMMKVTFDYSGVDPECKSKLIWCAGEINKQKANGLKAMLLMGRAIKDAQGLLANYGDGTFGRWIEAECGITPRSGYNYLRAWEDFGDCESLSQFTAEAMYLLSAPSAPPQALARAKKLAAKGDRIDKKVALGLLNAQKDLSASPTNGHIATSPTAKPEASREVPVSTHLNAAEPPNDPNSLEAVQTDLREFERRLRDLTRYGRKILGAEGNDITRPWCGRYSIIGIIHPLHEVARTVLNDLPVGGTPKNPKLEREAIAARAGRAE